jgi:molybdopterin-binding protein
LEKVSRRTVNELHRLPRFLLESGGHILHGKLHIRSRRHSDFLRHTQLTNKADHQDGNQAQPSNVHCALPSAYNDCMPISARNKLRGKIEEIQLGDIMAHVVVRVGDNLIESAITRRSADELKLKKGDTVSAGSRQLRS